MRPPTGRFCSSFAKPTRSLFHAESRSSTVNTEIIKIIMFREPKLKKFNKLAILVSVTCIFPHQLDFLSGSSILARILWILWYFEEEKILYFFSYFVKWQEWQRRFFLDQKGSEIYDFDGKNIGTPELKVFEIGRKP